MGLDTFAVFPKDDGTFAIAPREAFVGITHLCGGIFSCNGDTSFRGKVYADFVERVTGQSLYQHLIPPVVVGEMASRMEAVAAEVENDDDASDCAPSLDEVKDLAKFFRVCADNGYSLHGWW